MKEVSLKVFACYIWKIKILPEFFMILEKHCHVSRLEV